MLQAVAPFVLDSHEFEPPYADADADGVRYAKSHIDKTFRGDLEATSTVEMLSSMSESGAGYVALERVTGTLGGRSGSFALLHIGTMAGSETWAKWPIVPGSGTGELAGITGEARIEIAEDGSHTLHVDYDFA